jgi:AcrR family transcriptional regulator
MPSAPRTARARVRDEVTREILAVATVHLARDSAGALSLRSIARDLQMAPSALYRYFDGRDALLTALIVEAYLSLADAVEEASDAAPQGAGDDGERWLAVPRAMRAWALARPHEWALLFGSPVPGYRAPEETIAPYTRIAAALLRPVTEAQEHGRLDVVEECSADAVALGRALAPVHDALLPDGATSTVQRLLHVWATLIGVISLEIFGHWRDTVLDPALFFETTMGDAARFTGLRP